MFAVARRTLFARAALARPAAQARWCSEKAKDAETEKNIDLDADEAPKTEEPAKEEEKCPKEEKIAELQKSVAYSLAEAENARKIAQKDVESARQYALKGFAKELLDVVDNLTRALESVDNSKLADNKDLSVLHKGVEMTSGSLTKILAKNGVTAQEAKAGTPFDPTFHEALFNIPLTEGAEPNTIGQVVKVGFNYKDRVLRPTQCGVIADA